MLHFTNLTPFFLVKPENKYLSIPSGTGATAVKTVPGSVPITIATSIFLFCSFNIL